MKTYCGLIPGVRVFPEMLLLVLTWQTFTMANRKKNNETSIIFENVKFYNEILVKTNDPPKICVSITKGSKNFEVRIYLCYIIF